MEIQLPKCCKCTQENRTLTGTLLPLSDYGQEGSTVQFKAWTCSNPNCGYTVRIDKGDVSEGKSNPARR